MKEKTPVLISACLTGSRCKYSGGSNALHSETIDMLSRRFKLIPVCPEVAGGLGVPREPSERRENGVVSVSGKDVTKQFVTGAETAAKLCSIFGCRTALLKANSPSCSNSLICDGTFTGKLIAGRGVAAELLEKRGIQVYNENEIEKMSDEIIDQETPSLSEILAICDHTLLRTDCTADEIRSLCDQAIKYGCASVCIPPCHVAGAKRYVGNKMKICTVIGFPNGYMTTASKDFEASDAIKNGADEIDMVINLSMVKDRQWKYLEEDIAAVRKATKGHILKVIIECCLLTDEEKIRLCGIVADSGADFIKTSTGFSKGGATFEDVRLMNANCPENLEIKAAGGISSLEDAAMFIKLGASRLGTSRIVKIAMEKEENADLNLEKTDNQY